MDKVEHFVRVLDEQRILQPDQLAELKEFQPRYADSFSLSKYLVQRGWLTVYQANRILQGEGRELVVGRYRILDLLGQGAVSQVFKAWDTREKCVRALKMIRAEHWHNSEAVGRFKREMQIISSLNHPNIVRAYDVDLENTRHYFAMEYVEGTDLGKMVKLSGKLPAAEACDFVRQAAFGLQHAYEHNLVHRDIKPANLLVSPGRLVKILDLGMARLRPSGPAHQSLQRLTMEGVMIGTPDFLAPEQARRPREVDIRADIYSLGCTLFFLLAGEVPYPGRTIMEKLLAHQQAEPDWSKAFPYDEPEGLINIVWKMMAKKPEDRYQTPAEVAAALAPYVLA
ncbi:MAG: hypothetical protein KatS3mg105_3027 [Gemmatales bacterium]|nr:MAG: hypothetical protein KatS3mg105_3027 [Gemmatales bacterium]